LGFILLLKVTSADIQDRDGARLLLLDNLKKAFGWLRVIWADGGYTGKLIGEIASIIRHRRLKLEIIKRSDDVKGFKILPKRWIVERTFGWLIQSRRLVRDYEVLELHSESMIYLSQRGCSVESPPKRFLRRPLSPPTRCRAWRISRPSSHSSKE
jgi:transposase